MNYANAERWKSQKESTFLLQIKKEETGQANLLSLAREDCVQIFPMNFM